MNVISTNNEHPDSAARSRAEPYRPVRRVRRVRHLNIQRNQVNATLMLQGLTRTQFAERAGLSYATVRDVLAGHCTAIRTRARIERAIGFPLWSTPRVWALRCNVLQRVGDDPAIMRVSALREAALNILGERISPRMSRAQVLERLEEYFATKEEKNNTRGSSRRRA